jgi:signal transduction histidine kinase
MSWIQSYRSKLQASLFILGLLVIGVTYWQASAGATAALRQTTYDHLTAIRETKRRLIEDYFSDLTNHVLALSTDESSIVALERFRSAWDRIPALNPGDPRHQALLRYYEETFTPEVVQHWFPESPRTRWLQHIYISGSPHPVGSKDLLVDPGTGDPYSEAHSRHHPTLYRYLTAFGFYDIFLIDAREGRILYTVTKEIDLGVSLKSSPYQHTTLARAFARAISEQSANTAVIEDYAPYVASHFAPAAFAAAPIWRAGSIIGVLAIQVSIDHVNRVMTGDRHWEGEGLGRTGHAYIVGPDGTLRSDLRFEIEQPEAFLAQLKQAGFPDDAIDRIRRNRTAILNLSLPTQAGIIKDFRNVEVIRSNARLNLPGLDWTLVAEMATEEAFEPVATLRKRLLATGLLVAAAFIAAAWILARSVTRPVMALVEGTHRLGGRDFGVRLPVESADEIGQLAVSFNRMAERLEQTTVSRDDLDRVNQELELKQRELEALNARLISAQEEERSRIARELHDDLTQRLAAVAIAAGTLKRTGKAAEADYRKGLDFIQRELAQISADIHGISRRLHPATLDDLGLVAAIESECRGFFERGGPPVDFVHSGRFDAPSKDAELALYRIVQEALRNALRHSGASEVTVRLLADADQVTLEVEDNGRGYDAQSPEFRPGLGLASMQERARLLGGRVTLDSRPGEGTRVSATLPVNGSI